MQVFEFTASSPPTNQQLEVISQSLLTSLCDHMGIAFEATDMHLESSSWVTLKIRSDPIHKPLLDMVFVGIISYSLRDATPSIQSVLLPFSKGRRLSIGRNTILIANYVEDEAGGGWEDFIWSVDEYGEWECEELPHV